VIVAIAIAVGGPIFASIASIEEKDIG